MLKENDLNTNILIDFFLTVGLPTNIASNLIEGIKHKFKGNFKSLEAYDYVC